MDKSSCDWLVCANFYQFTYAACHSCMMKNETPNLSKLNTDGCLLSLTWCRNRWRQELHCHVEDCLGRNLRARCTPLVFQVIDTIHTQLTGDMTSVWPLRCSLLSACHVASLGTLVCHRCCRLFTLRCVASSDAHSPNYCSRLAVCVNYSASFYCKIALIIRFKLYSIKTDSNTPKKTKRKQKQCRIYLTFAFSEHHVTSPSVTLYCRLTNYELLRWLVETPSRDFAHYRLSGGRPDML